MYVFWEVVFTEAEQKKSFQDICFSEQQKKEAQKKIFWPLKIMFFYSYRTLWCSFTSFHSLSQTNNKNKIKFHFYSCETYKIFLWRRPPEFSDGTHWPLFYIKLGQMSITSKKVILYQVCVSVFSLFSRGIIWILEKNLHKTMR